MRTVRPATFELARQLACPRRPDRQHRLHGEPALGSGSNMYVLATVTELCSLFFLGWRTGSRCANSGSRPPSPGWWHDQAWQA